MMARRALLRALAGLPMAGAMARIAEAEPSLEANAALAQIVSDTPGDSVVEDAWLLADLADQLDRVRMVSPHESQTPSIQAMRSWSPAFKAHCESEKRIEHFRRSRARRRWAELVRRSLPNRLGSV